MKVIPGLIVGYRVLLAILTPLVLLVFAIGFLTAGANNEGSGITGYAATTNAIPKLSSGREALLEDLMSAGHWEAEQSEGALFQNQLTMQNFHQHLTLVGVYAAKGVQAALFMLRPQSGWQSAIKDATNGLDQVSVTPDGRLRASPGEEIAPEIKILAINTDHVVLSVGGERYTKHLYALSRSEEPAAGINTRAPNPE